MEWVKAIILGVLQGLTEFLPVSSSGHLAIAKGLFGISTNDIAFEIVVHAATSLSVIVVFWKDIVKLFNGVKKFEYNTETQYVLMLLVSMIPVAIVGLFFKDKVESLFATGPLNIGCALLVTAMLLVVSQMYSPRHGHRMTFKRAILMGIAQAVAVIPGLSRSGATIATGLLSGARKEEAARFSFLMVLVPILGEAFLELVSGGLAHSSMGVVPLALGFVSAYLSGVFACKVMIEFVKNASLGWFAIYCTVVGIICLIV